ncbi:MAG: hypothetical protein K0A90_08225 [Methanosarcinaceae archaeon]|nr:hypothetical protein [Methanosarcinaceae archaeon]
MPISQLDYVTTFIWLYNIGAAFIILFLILQIMFMSRKLDVGVIRARLFLNTDVLNETWIHISIAGVAFAINAFAGFLKFNTDINTYYIWEISEIIFLGAFVAMLYQWYHFINGLTSDKNKYD